MKEIEVSVPFVIIEHENKFISNFVFLAKFIIAEVAIDRIGYFFGAKFSTSFNLTVLLSTLFVLCIVYTTNKITKKLRQQKVFRNFIIFFKENNLQSKVSEQDFTNAEFICLKEDGDFKIFKNKEFGAVYSTLKEYANNERLTLYLALISFSLCGIVKIPMPMAIFFLAIVFSISSYYISSYVGIQKEIFN